MKHESFNDQGIELIRKNQFIEAKNSFEKALQFKPNFTEAINLSLIHISEPTRRS